MDTVTETAITNIICGVVANGLTALIAYIGRKGCEIVPQEALLRRSLGESPPLVTILQKATASIAKTAKFDDQRDSEKLRTFLVSPDVDAIVRQLYASQLIETPNVYVKSIRAEFLASLSLRLGEPAQNLQDLAEYLFEVLQKGCEQALAVAIDHGSLSAHEAISAARHRLILDELAGIQKNLTLLTAPRKLDIQAILAFEQQYRQQVGSRHAYIVPPHFDAARKVPIDELYVPSDLIRLPRRRGEEPDRLKVSDFLAVTYRTALLGNPGGGKSTFTLKLCHDLASRYSERLFAGRQATPILVVLRNYGVEKKARSCSILQFIEATANSTYQIQPPPGAFEYLLLNGHAVVIFDGLDELLDTSYRQEISGDVESFCTLYPSVPVLVTSREVGYEQAPLDEKRFERFRLTDFDEGQVQEYARKWFAIDTELTSEQQQQKAKAFFTESRMVADLCANPLMLALMCNIYRGENYIPRNRPDVYEKCAVMLFERWDKSRGLFVPLPFEAHISAAMKYLAHWIYADATLQEGVTEEHLVAKTTEYLCEWRFEDRDEARKAACEFIEFCRGRAWVFTDTGTRREGEGLYQFTHRTFLEYFTAAHLVRTCATPDALGAVLWPRIAKGEWDVIAQLAFQLQHKNIEGAGDDLLIGLIKQARESEEDDAGWLMLFFATRCLEFMVPRPKTTREIVVACIEYSLAWSVKNRRQQLEPRELVGTLLYAASENRMIIADSLEKLLVEQINGSDEQVSVQALEIGLQLSMFLRSRRRGPIPQREWIVFWDPVSDRIFNASFSRIKELIQKYFGPCMIGYWRGQVALADLVSWHGVDALFRPYRNITLSLRRVSLAEAFINDAITDRIPSKQSRRYKDLKEAGRILLSSAPPWVSSNSFLRAFPGRMSHSRWFLDQRHVPSQSPAKVLSLESDIFFGVFALGAVTLESMQKERTALLQVIKSSDSSLFYTINRILSARFEQAETVEVQAAMDSCGFTTEQQAFAWQWIRGQVNLVQREATSAETEQEHLADEEQTEISDLLYRFDSSPHNPPPMDV